MSLTELIPILKKLSYSDQLLLSQFLVAELLNASALAPLETYDKLASQGLQDSFEAAAILTRALATV
jgi:hypothetical protein